MNLCNRCRRRVFSDLIVIDGRGYGSRCAQIVGAGSVPAQRSILEAADKRKQRRKAAKAGARRARRDERQLALLEVPA